MEEKKELSMEVRLLLAFLLMGVVLFVTPYFYKQPPAQPSTKTAVQTSPDTAKTDTAKTDTGKTDTGKLWRRPFLPSRRSRFRANSTPNRKRFSPSIRTSTG